MQCVMINGHCKTLCIMKYYWNYYKSTTVLRHLVIRMNQVEELLIVYKYKCIDDKSYSLQRQTETF